MNYQSATRKRAFTFSLGVIFADTPGEAERIASEHGMWDKRPDGTWGREASEAHAQLCRDSIDAMRRNAARRTEATA